MLQQSDPFPADALAEYLSYLYPEQKSSEQLEEWRETSLAQLYKAVASEGGGSGELIPTREKVVLP